MNHFIFFRLPQTLIILLGIFSPTLAIHINCTVNTSQLDYLLNGYECEVNNDLEIVSKNVPITSVGSRASVRISNEIYSIPVELINSQKDTDEDQSESEMANAQDNLKYPKHAKDLQIAKDLENKKEFQIFGHKHPEKASASSFYEKILETFENDDNLETNLESLVEGEENQAKVTENQAKVTKHQVKVAENQAKVTENLAKLTQNPAELTQNPAEVTENDKTLSNFSLAEILFESIQGVTNLTQFDANFDQLYANFDQFETKNTTNSENFTIFEDYQDNSTEINTSNLTENSISMFSSTILSINSTSINSFIIYYKKVFYFPSNISSHFPDLKLIAIVKSQLKEVTQSDLKPFENLIGLWLPYNQLETLEWNLFDFNKELKQIILIENRIKFIHSSTFAGVNRIKQLDLLANICVDEQGATEEDVVNILQHLKEKCEVDCNCENYFIVFMSIVAILLVFILIYACLRK